MFDLKLIRATDSLPITSIDIESMYPLVFILTGDYYEFASTVLLNADSIARAAQSDDNLYTGSFQILGTNKIRLVAPKKLWDVVIDSVIVLGQDVVSLNETTNVTFEFKDFLKIQGISKVTQHLLKLLGTTPGSDFFNPAQGGGLYSFVGTTMDTTNVQGLMIKIHQAIKKCVSHIRTSQKAVLWRLPQDEILLDAIPVDVAYDPDALGVYITLNIMTAARSAVVKVGV